MRRTVFLTAALLSALAGGVQAEDAPARKDVTETIEIAAPVSKVWEVVGDLEDSSWVENVDITLEQGGDPAESTRTLTLRNGRAIVEKGSAYDPENHTLAYAVIESDPRDLPAGAYSATISVKPSGDHSTVEWAAKFSPDAAKGEAASDQSDDSSEKAVRAWARASLANLKEKIEHPPKPMVR